MQSFIHRDAATNLRSRSHSAGAGQWHILPLATELNNFLQTEKQPRTALTVNFTDPICLDMPSAYCAFTAYLLHLVPCCILPDCCKLHIVHIAFVF